MIEHKSMPQLYIQIERQTKDRFKKQYNQKFRKNANSEFFTVLSSFSLIHKYSGKLEIVSIGFGTKSLPYQVAKNHQHKVIKDMHAQILARKGLCKFIKSQIPQPGEQNQYFSWVAKKKKHSLREQILLIFYSSQNFCGDCMVDCENQMFSGAKPLKYFSLQNIPQQKYQKNCLRTKPGRLDLPISKRSLSLSCSDKIGLWNILGVQGRRLFNKITPIYISDIVIEVHPGQERHRLQKGINLLQRISELKKMSIQTVLRKVFKIVVNGQERYITNQFKCHVPNIHIVEKSCDEKQKQKQLKSLQVCGIITQNEINWLNGKTGLPQGVNINKNVGKTSDFATKNMYSQIESNMEEEFKYTAIKERIKLLFGEWTDDYKKQ